MTPGETHRASSPAKGQVFTTTHWSVVLKAGDPTSPQAAEALERLCRACWYPLYAHVRRQGYQPHDAQDLTQGFFARLLEKHAFEGLDRQKGKFRSFLLASLEHFLANERDRARAAKRGGGHTFVSFDPETAEHCYLQDPAADLAPEKVFDRRWALALLERALVRLREEYASKGKIELFNHLKAFLTNEAKAGAYDPLAAQLQMQPGSVAVAVRRLRERYRELVRKEIADTVASPADIDEEMRCLFAALG